MPSSSDRSVSWASLGWDGGAAFGERRRRRVRSRSWAASPGAAKRERPSPQSTAAARRSLDELLGSDIDGVLVATPHTTHADLVVAAARAGKHVFVDKPITLTLAEADRAIDATDHAGVVLQVGHNRRRQPANRRIKTALDGGDWVNCWR